MRILRKEQELADKQMPYTRQNLNKVGFFSILSFF